jgi:hypothetical protein
MKGDPRFPPPRGHEGYRDAASPGAEAIEPASSHRHHHVIATHADDPEHPDVPVIHPAREPHEKPPAMRRVIVAFVMLLIVLVSVVLIGRLMRSPAPIKPATPARSASSIR